MPVTSDGLCQVVIQLLWDKAAPTLLGLDVVRALDVIPDALRGTRSTHDDL